MRVLTLQPEPKGGIGCVSIPKPLEWRSSLSPTTSDITGVSMMVREEDGKLDIIAVDSRRNVELRTAKVHVKAAKLPTADPRPASPVSPWSPGPISITSEMSSEPAKLYELPGHKEEEKSRMPQELSDRPL